MEASELEALKRRLDASREFNLPHPDGRRQFRLRVPLPWEQRLMLARSMVAEGKVELAQVMQFDMVMKSLVAWSGVTVKDAFHGVEDKEDPLPYSSAAARILLERDVALVDLLGDAVNERILKENERLEADAKNSASDSTTSAQQPNRESKPES